MKYAEVKNYVVKCRAYPTSEQKEKIDSILNGIRVAYNVTAYSISHSDENVTRADKKDENLRWPNFSACMKKEWLNHLRETEEAVKVVPSTVLASSVYGIFCDMKKSWEKQKLPCPKWKPEFYNARHPRKSFTVQAQASGFVFSGSIVRVPVTNIGKVKVRGFRQDLRYGDSPSQTFEEYYSDQKKAFGVTVSKDNCGDYWIAVKLQTVWKPDKSKSNPIPIGVDVGIKDIAITSEGTKYENKKFKRSQKRRIRRLSRKVSRRQGWSNIEFREAHKKDKELTPSKNYNSSVLKKAKLERKIARQRDNWNHNVTADIVNSASFIGVEDLLVKGMMKNRHMAYSATDAAMGDVLQKLKYKAEWQRIPIQQIGRFEPSSQLCHVCGYQNRNVKNLSIREWTCPECGSHHDRDINAAINIRNMALKTYENNAS